MNQLFASSGQSIGTSASASVLPMIIQDWFPSGLTGLISLQSKGLSRVFSTIVWKHQLYGTQFSLEKAMAPRSSALAWKIPRTEEPGGLPSTGSHRVGHDWSDSVAAAVVFLVVQLSYPYRTTGKTVALTIWIFVGKVILSELLFIETHQVQFSSICEDISTYFCDGQERCIHIHRASLLLIVLFVWSFRFWQSENWSDTPVRTGGPESRKIYIIMILWLPARSQRER